MRRLLASCAGAFALAIPAAATAAPVDLGITSNAVDVVMTDDGAAHVASLQAGGPNVTLLKICRIPAGGSVCAATASATVPDGVISDLWIVSDGTRVTAVVGDGNGAGGRTYAMSSPNGTSAYTGLTQIANVTATDAELAPGGTRLWLTAANGSSDSSNDYLAFTSAPLPPAAQQTAAAVLGTASGGRSVDGQLVGITPEGRPLAFLAGSAPDLASGSYYRAFAGTDASSAAQLIDASRWGAVTPYDLADPFQRNGSYDVTSAHGRLWLGYEGLGRDTVLRQWSGGAFGAAITPDCTNRRFAAGLQEAPDVAVTRTGALLVTEVGSDGTDQHLGFFAGAADGSAFSPYQELAAGHRIQDVETADDPTSDTGGIAVWTSDDIYIDQGHVSFTRLPAAATAACPPPPAPAGPGTPPPGGGGTTPVVRPGTPVTPKPKATKSVNARVGGASLTLAAPNACVASGKTYSLKLTYKKAKRGGTLVTVTKVVFSGSGARAVTDRRAPFSARLKVGKGTRKVAVAVRVTVRLTHHRTTTKTIRTTLAVC